MGRRDGPSSWISEDSTWPATGIALAKNGIQFILENLELLLHNQTSIPPESLSVRLLYEHLKFSRLFLERLQMISSFPLSKLEDLIGDLLREVKTILYATDSCVYRTIIVEKNTTSWLPTNDFDQYCRGIEDLVKRMRKLEEEINVAPAVVVHSGHDESSSSSSHKNSTTSIGFDEEKGELLGKLLGAGGKQLMVISIIGMGGIGKTTLAQTLFNDPQVVLHFHVRAWNFFSQEYDKRKSLTNILSYMIDAKDPVFNSSDSESIGQRLYKSLKGRKYLIVIDGIWDIGQWKDIKMYFPEDNTSSRILLTSRIRDVALEIAPDISPHLLRFLTPDESWDLFESRVFPENNGVPEELTKLGKHIVERCQGLPLAICVVAGILVKEEKTEEQWRRIANNIGKKHLPKRESLWETPSDFSEHYMDILELSYKHLPWMLQSCFLYLGTYSDDTSISVKKLLFSWIAEGLIIQQQNTDQSLEDTAEDCLKELIHRSLVIVVERRSDGGVKLCRIHDLLRDLCHTEVEEKKFLQPICQCGAIYEGFCYRVFDSPHIVRPFHQCWPHFHFHKSPFYASVRTVFNKESFPVYRFLRRLELKNVVLLDLPKQISLLFHLRYLELQVDRVTSHLSSVFQLWNLETCILYVDKGGRFQVPYEFWTMIKLRHLQISQELVFSAPQCFTESRVVESSVLDEAIYPTLLENLQTISQLCPSGSVNNVLARTPNLRKLGLHMSLSVSNEHFDFPNLAHLDLLQTIKFEYQTLGIVPLTVPRLQLHKFPPNLKKLTLIGSHLQWEEMSIISMLPSLEILKLKNNFFSGPLWETSDDGFLHLKFLKLSHMDLQKWISLSDHFPKLEHLVLNGCLDLEEIPLEIGDINTLQTIKVYGSSNSTMESANQIQESQKSIGNDDLKIFISHQFEGY